MGATFIGLVLPIITIVIFVTGMAYRIFVWRKLPKPQMTLFPAPEPGKARFKALLKETFLFSSLFKSDKNLWTIGWVFHAMLALILVGHLRVISWLPDRMLHGMGMSEESVGTMSAAAGGAAGVVILVMGLFILARRLAVPRVRQISNPGDYIAMVLILAIVVTGDAMRFIGHFDLAETREYFRGLLTFSTAALPTNAWFLAHYLLGQILIMYMPFSKILHFGGIFFTEALVQKR